MSEIEIESRTLGTPAGAVYCMSVRDLQDVMEKYIGYEFAVYVAHLISENKADEAYAEARACTDADAIAEENDYLRTQLQDTQEILTQVTNDITKKSRLNKNELFNKLLALIDSINAIL